MPKLTFDTDILKITRRKHFFFALPKAIGLGWRKGERLHMEAVTDIGNVFLGTKI